MRVRLVHITNDAESLITYCARVSSPHQDSGQSKGLLNYCIKNKHWSIFEMASMCVEIETSRAISAQILRHRSFHFQEFSQRYAEVNKFEMYPARRQDTKNRQNSIDDMTEETKDWFDKAQIELCDIARSKYTKALELGIAKEQARFLLPQSTQTKLYMHSNVRDWIHYLDLRTSNGTQQEHKEIAEAIKSIFVQHLPIISQALEWNK